MSKILVFGSDGMLGSALVRRLRDSGVSVIGTSLSGSADIQNIDISSLHCLRTAFLFARPTVVINCAGIVKSETQNEHMMYEVNARAPHQIAAIAKTLNCKLLHISTDCVFDGKNGNYDENSSTNANDAYGRSKAEGEDVARHPHCVVLRTSFIGRDLRRKRGLLEWLLRSDTVVGFSKAKWSGLSAPELARVITKIALTCPEISGLYNVPGPVITKANLIRLLAKSFKLNTQISDAENPVIDRTLNGDKLKNEIGYSAPDWKEMANELAEQS